MIEAKKIKDIVGKIVRYYNPDKIILFGSYGYGKPDEDSDLDLLIIKDSLKPRPERGIEIRKLLYGAMIPMDIVVYTNKEIKDSINTKSSFIYQAVMNGQTLYERSN